MLTPRISPRTTPALLALLALAAYASTGCSAPSEDATKSSSAVSSDIRGGQPTADSPVDAGAASASAALAAATSAGSLTPSGVPAGYVATPGGWFHPSCVHEVPNGAHVNDDGDVISSGAVIAHYGKCPYASVQSGPASAAGNTHNPTINNWVEDTYQQAPAGHAWDLIEENIVVPPLPPSGYVGQTLFYFPGFESDLGYGSNCGIIQPVLQYGNSAAGGSCTTSSCSWEIASWHAWGSSSGQAVWSSIAKVNPGDTLQMEAYLYGVANGLYDWIITAYDTTTGAGSNLYFDTQCIYDQAFPATFEAYNLSACNQMPFNHVNFTNIGLYAAISNWNTYTNETYSPTNQFGSNGGLTNCGFAIGNAGTETTLWQ